MAWNGLTICSISFSDFCDKDNWGANAGGLANSFSARRTGHPLASRTWPQKASTPNHCSEFQAIPSSLLKMRPFSSSTASNSAPCKRAVLYVPLPAASCWRRWTANIIPALRFFGNMAVLLFTVSKAQQVLGVTPVTIRDEGDAGKSESSTSTEAFPALTNSALEWSNGRWMKVVINEYCMLFFLFF